MAITRNLSITPSSHIRNIRGDVKNKRELNSLLFTYAAGRLKKDDDGKKNYINNGIII